MNPKPPSPLPGAPNGSPSFGRTLDSLQPIPALDRPSACPGPTTGGAKRETSGHCICHTRRRQGRLHWDLAGHDVYRGPVVRNGAFFCLWQSPRGHWTAMPCPHGMRSRRRAYKQRHATALGSRATKPTMVSCCVLLGPGQRVAPGL